MFKSPQEVIDYIEREEVQFLDIRFCDLPGVMQHFNIPAKSVDIDALAEGQMFDGSSIRGFVGIHESDMKLLPDFETAFVDPFREAKTLVLNYAVVDPFTDEPYGRDPRSIARRSEEYLASTGIADTVFIGAEAEFHVFDDVRYEDRPGASFYAVDAESAAWNTGREEIGGNQGYKVSTKGGYFPVFPTDHYADLRDRIVMNSEKVGLEMERSHHEVGSAGQQEINYRFNTLLRAGDDMMKFKYVVKGTAWEEGRSATFMPKPVMGDNGSGMHTHQSLWKDGEPLFYDENGYGQLSDVARWYIGGLLKHAPALLAFTNPTLNSFRRLVPGYEAPVNLVYSARNRSACVRIPITGSSPKAKRVEFRVPDPSSNPYLCFAAQLMAGIDGIRNRIEPPEPVDKDLYELPPEEQASIEQLPASLEEALAALDADHDFLTEGDVFSEDLIAAWIDYKRTHEIAPMRLRPHPYEYEMYYHI